MELSVIRLFTIGKIESSGSVPASETLPYSHHAAINLTTQQSKLSSAFRTSFYGLNEGDRCDEESSTRKSDGVEYLAALDDVPDVVERSDLDFHAFFFHPIVWLVDFCDVFSFGCFRTFFSQGSLRAERTGRRTRQSESGKSGG